MRRVQLPLLMLLVGCPRGPDPAAVDAARRAIGDRHATRVLLASEDARPDWTLRPPPAPAGSRLFVGVGEAEDLGAAQRAAHLDLAVAAASFVSVDVESLHTASESASGDGAHVSARELLRTEVDTELGALRVGAAYWEAVAAPLVAGDRRHRVWALGALPEPALEAARAGARRRRRAAVGTETWALVGARSLVDTSSAAPLDALVEQRLERALASRVALSEPASVRAVRGPDDAGRRARVWGGVLPDRWVEVELQRLGDQIQLAAGTADALDATPRLVVVHGALSSLDAVIESLAAGLVGAARPTTSAVVAPPDRVEAHDPGPVARAWSALAGGRPEEARAAFVIAAAQRPDDPSVWLGLGRALERLGRFAVAASAVAGDPMAARGAPHHCSSRQQEAILEAARGLEARAARSRARTDAAVATGGIPIDRLLAPLAALGTVTPGEAAPIACAPGLVSCAGGSCERDAAACAALGGAVAGPTVALTETGLLLRPVELRASPLPDAPVVDTASAVPVRTLLGDGDWALIEHDGTIGWAPRAAVGLGHTGGPCQLDVDCPAGWCEAELGVCRAGCRRDSDCGPSDVCGPEGGCRCDPRRRPSCAVDDYPQVRATFTPTTSLSATDIPEDAAAAFARAWTVAARVGDDRSEWEAYAALAHLALRVDRLDAAASLAQGLVASSRRGGDLRRLALGRRLQGAVLRRRSRPAAAVRRLREARDLFGLLGDRVAQLDVLSELGGAWVELGRPAEAGRALGLAERIAADLGDAATRAVIAQNLGVLAAWRGRGAEARARWAEAWAGLADGADRDARIAAALDRGLGLAWAGLAAEAEESFARAAADLDETDQDGRRLELGLSRGTSLARLGDPDTAAVSLATAWYLAERLGRPRAQAAAQDALLALELDLAGAAGRTLDCVLGVYAELAAPVFPPPIGWRSADHVDNLAPGRVEPSDAARAADAAPLLALSAWRPRSLRRRLETYGEVEIVLESRPAAAAASGWSIGGAARRQPPRAAAAAVPAAFVIEPRLPVLLRPEWTGRPIPLAVPLARRMSEGALRHLSRDGDARARASAALNAGALAWLDADPEVAYARLMAAQQAFGALGDVSGLEVAHRWLARVLAESGAPLKAAEHEAAADALRPAPRPTGSSPADARGPR